MATFLFLAQLLFLGTLVVSAQTDTGPCHQLWNATEGNFSVQVTPTVYQANTTYQVTIKDNSNTTSKPPAQYVLQALSPQNESLGEWKGVTVANCSSLATAILNTTQNAATWTSPGRNVSSVQIKAYIIVPEKPTELKIHALGRAPDSTVTPPTTPSSVSTIQSSSFFIALFQLPLLLATSTLLS